tara:strand:+ start:45 stop:563 length:519 start_codon:yes stop_codon:yes gene_type:complete
MELLNFASKRKKPIGLLDLEFNTEIPSEPSLDSQILNGVSDRLGVDAIGLLQFADKVAGMESDFNPKSRNSKSSAKGMYQFTDDSFVTAKNRLKNISGKIPSRIRRAKSVLDLSPSDQKTLFFAHLTEDDGSDERMLDYLEGRDSGGKLYLNNHYKGTPDKSTLKRMKKFFP